MKKPSVYLDTTFISAFWYEGHDILNLARRILTREWWDRERPNFEVWVSRITLVELQAGRYPRQADACKMAQRIRHLSLNREIREFSDKLVTAGIIPGSKPNDAMQMAVASVHRIDFLLTWNYAHLANPETQRRLEQQCREAGYRAPIMVTAESIPSARRGQNIRRNKHADR